MINNRGYFNLSVCQMNNGIAFILKILVEYIPHFKLEIRARN